MSAQKKAPNQIIKPILLGKIVQNNQKTSFRAVFSILGPFGHPHRDPKREPKGPQVGETFGLMSKLKDKPLTKLLGLFFFINGPNQSENRFLYFFLSPILGPIGHPHWTQTGTRRSTSGWDVRPNN
jgi:hypothetical protein